MPQKFDFEARYNASAAQPFDQKNEMFKRMRWEEKFAAQADAFRGAIPADGRNGASNENLALRNAAWSIERGYAHGVGSGNFGMFKWDDEHVAQGVAGDDPNTPFDFSDPEHNSRVIKKAGKFFGAAMTGICELDRRWIYSKGYDGQGGPFDFEIPDEYKYLIVIAVEMDYEHSRFLPNYLGSASTGFGYSKMAITAGLMAQFLRRLGAKAIPCGNDTAMSIPYAIKAGLGELGRNGLLITPQYGPRVRLCKIFCDLPMKCDEPIEFGVEKFCRTCKLCATQCPSRSIPDGECTTQGHNISNSHGPKKWYVDAETCHEFWLKSRCDCGICIRVCPFNKPKGRLHDATRWIIERFPRLNRLMLEADRLCGYGKMKASNGYWK